MAMELTQQENSLVVNGFLKDKNLDHRTFHDTDTILGTVDVAFKHGDHHNVERINVFASQYTKAGKTNPSYQSLSKVESDYKAGGADADRVHVTGRLDYNIFQTRSGELVKTLRKNGAFFSRIGKDDKKYTNEARAHVILTITGYEDEIKNDAPTGNKIVHNVNVGYNNRINVIPNLTFNMKSLGDQIDTIVDTFPVGSTIDTQINFDDYAKVQHNTQAAHGFGHHEQMSVATQFVNNAEIDYIEAQPVNDTEKSKQALSKPQIRHAKDLLKQTIQETKNDHKDKTPSDAKNPFANNGKKRPISDDDVPF